MASYFLQHFMDVTSSYRSGTQYNIAIFSDCGNYARYAQAVKKEIANLKIREQHMP